MFELSLKKVLDQAYVMSLKSQMDGDIEYYHLMYYLSLLRKQYAMSVIQQAKRQVPKDVNLYNFFKYTTKTDHALDYHIMILGIENTMIQPLGSELERATGKLPENPFEKKDSHSMPEFKPKRV